MPWKEVLPMEEIMSFVFNIKAGEFSFASLCRRYQISRKVRFVKPCESGGESPLSLGGWSAQNSKWKQ
jgi:hypothetical protein